MDCAQSSAIQKLLLQQLQKIDNPHNMTGEHVVLISHVYMVGKAI